MIYNWDEHPNRLISQYRASPQFLKFLQVYRDETRSTGDLLNALSEVLDIDAAVGTWLDTIGAIVGQSRELVDVDILPYFGFLNAGNERAFNIGLFRKVGDPLTGSRYATDTEYRLLIKGRIASNHYTGTTENTLDVFSFILQANVHIADLTNDYTITVVESTSQEVLAFLANSDIFPKILGFKRNIVYTSIDYFAFADYPNAFGFGDGLLGTTLT